LRERLSQEVGHWQDGVDSRSTEVAAERGDLEEESEVQGIDVVRECETRGVRDRKCEGRDEVRVGT